MRYNTMSQQAGEQPISDKTCDEDSLGFCCDLHQNQQRDISNIRVLFPYFEPCTRKPKGTKTVNSPGRCNCAACECIICQYRDISNIKPEILYLHTASEHTACKCSPCECIVCGHTTPTEKFEDTEYCRCDACFCMYCSKTITKQVIPLSLPHKSSENPQIESDNKKIQCQYDTLFPLKKRAFSITSCKIGVRDATLKKKDHDMSEVKILNKNKSGSLNTETKKSVSFKSKEIVQSKENLKLDSSRASQIKNCANSKLIKYKHDTLFPLKNKELATPIKRKYNINNTPKKWVNEDKKVSKKTTNQLKHSPRSSVIRCDISKTKPSKNINVEQRTYITCNNQQTEVNYMSIRANVIKTTPSITAKCFTEKAKSFQQHKLTHLQLINNDLITGKYRNNVLNKELSSKTAISKESLESDDEHSKGSIENASVFNNTYKRVKKSLQDSEAFTNSLSQMIEDCERSNREYVSILQKI